MNKRGFSLIELLAVIVVLAVVALIATPIVLNVIDETKASSAKSEVSLILKGVTEYCEHVQMKKKLGYSIEDDFDCREESQTEITLTNEQLVKMVNNVDEGNDITVKLLDGKITFLTVQKGIKKAIYDPETGKIDVQDSDGEIEDNVPGGTEEDNENVPGGTEGDNENVPDGTEDDKENEQEGNEVTKEESIQGTWVFNDTIVFPTKYSYCIVSWDCHCYWAIQTDLTINVYPNKTIEYVYGSGIYKIYEVYSGGRWSDSKYKTITIERPNDEIHDAEGLLEFLNANATKQQ